MTYLDSGRAYLVCPRLLELDPRHGEHPAKWPPCRRGRSCRLDHQHEEVLVDPEGHLVELFIWVPGCRPPTEEDHTRCACGEKLVYADLDDLFDPAHLLPGAAGDGA